MRTIIDVPTVQLDALDALCRREKISRAEAIRQAVAAHLSRASAAARASVFGLWRDRGIDGLAYEREARAEWERPARTSTAPRRRSKRPPRQR